MSFISRAKRFDWEIEMNLRGTCGVQVERSEVSERVRMMAVYSWYPPPSDLKVQKVRNIELSFEENRDFRPRRLVENGSSPAAMTSDHWFRAVGHLKAKTLLRSPTIASTHRRLRVRVLVIFVASQHAILTGLPLVLEEC